MLHFIDIETVANPNLSPALIDSLTEGETDKKKFDIMSKFALSPLTGKICCISVLSVGQASHVETALKDQIQTFCSVDENLILGQFADSLGDFNYTFDTLVTFNGKSFDLPYLKVRSSVCNVRLIKDLVSKKYDQSSHYDVRSALGNFEQYAKGTLEEWCIAFGIDTGEIIPVSAIQEGYNSNEWSKIMQKNKNDIRMTAQLYLKIHNNII